MVLRGAASTLGLEPAGRRGAVVDVAGESVLLIRTKGGGAAGPLQRLPSPRLPAGAVPPVEPGGPRPARPAAGSLRCPYHSWTYASTGDLLRAPLHRDGRRRRPGGVRAAPGRGRHLGRVRVRAPDPGGGRRPCSTSSARCPSALRRYPLRRAVGRARASTYEVAANWKVLAENYNECYHCGPRPPGAVRPRARVPARRAATLDWERRHPPPRGRVDVHDDRARPTGAPFPGLDEDERVRHKGELVYPNLLLSLSADHVASFTPDAARPGRTTIVCDLLFHPDEIAEPRLRPVRRGSTSGTWSTARTGRSARACSAAWRRAAYTGGWFAPMEDPSLDIRALADCHAAATTGAVRDRVGDDVRRRRARRRSGSATCLGARRRRGRRRRARAVRARARRGASHDHSRIIRRSYHTPGYVRLAGAAYDAWAGSSASPASGSWSAPAASTSSPPAPRSRSTTTRRRAGRGRRAVRVLDAAAVMRRWPQLHARPDDVVGAVPGRHRDRAGGPRPPPLLRAWPPAHGPRLLGETPVTAVRDLGIGR